MLESRTDLRVYTYCERLSPIFRPKSACWTRRLGGGNGDYEPYRESECILSGRGGGVLRTAWVMG